jgi:hypothetical protein
VKSFPSLGKCALCVLCVVLVVLVCFLCWCVHEETSRVHENRTALSFVGLSFSPKPFTFSLPGLAHIQYTMIQLAFFARDSLFPSHFLSAICCLSLLPVLFSIRILVHGPGIDWVLYGPFHAILLAPLRTTCCSSRYCFRRASQDGKQHVCLSRGRTRSIRASSTILGSTNPFLDSIIVVATSTPIGATT